MSHTTADDPTVYGLSNCGTVKKLLVSLRAEQRPFLFHDFKKLGVSGAQLDRWLAQIDWQLLLNRKGTTWRSLPASVQASVIDTASARAVMLQHPSCIKRPVVEWQGTVTVGYTSLPDTPSKNRCAHR
ncbi:MAG: ArsC/Spx/MgsR family protein [Burkholderiaceae bacterium]|jgi:arsenate reductase